MLWFVLVASLMRDSFSSCRFFWFGGVVSSLCCNQWDVSHFSKGDCWWCSFRSWISPSVVISCLFSVYWCVVRAIPCLCCCLVRLILMLSVTVAAFFSPTPSIVVCGVSVLEILMGSHVSGWCMFLLLWPHCICVSFWFAGTCTVSFLVGWRISSAFAGFCIPWGSFRFYADFSCCEGSGIVSS